MFSARFDHTGKIRFLSDAVSPMDFRLYEASTTKNGLIPNAELNLFPVFDTLANVGYVDASAYTTVQISKTVALGDVDGDSFISITAAKCDIYGSQMMGTWM